MKQINGKTDATQILCDSSRENALKCSAENDACDDHDAGCEVEMLCIEVELVLLHDAGDGGPAYGLLPLGMRERA